MTRRNNGWQKHLLGHHEFRELKTDDLFVDPAYQRELNDSAIKRYVANFDANLFEPVTVNERKGTQTVFALLDGQHRKATAQTLGMRDMTCRVLHVDRSTEADVFVRLNKSRLFLAPVPTFRAELAAGNPACIEIKRCLADRQLTIGKSEDTESIAAVVTLKKIYSRGGYVRLGRVLDTAILSWPQFEPSRFAGSLLLGLDEWLGDEPSNGKVHATPEKLARATPNQILAKANNRWHAHRALGHNDRTAVSCIAEEIGAVYRSTKKRPGVAA
jgi:hypothetical protein